jgi:hypothetical protein
MVQAGARYKNALVPDQGSIFVGGAIQLEPQRCPHRPSLDVNRISLFSTVRTRGTQTAGGVMLLQILVKRLIVNARGEIVDYKLDRLFTDLRQIAEGQGTRKINSGGSDQIRLGAHTRSAGNPALFCF